MTGHRVGVRFLGERPPDLGAAAAGRVPFTAVVTPGARLRPGFVPAAERALTDAGADTCLYSDFAVAGQGIAVGDWSVERARWQHWTGPVMVVPTRCLDTVSDPLIDPPRLSRDVRHLSEVLVDIDNDDLRELTSTERARFTGQLPYTLAGTATDPSRTLPHLPTRSLVIPTRGSTGHLSGESVRWLDECLASLPAVLEDPAVDVVLVLDDDADPGFTQAWQQSLGDRLTILSAPGPFNFSAKVNMGVAHARGEVVALLNDDVAALTPDWLDRMTAVAMEPDVGAVGAVLLYEDGSVQHRGHVFTAGGVHLLDRGEARADPGFRERNLCDRDVSGITAACIVQRRDVWNRMRGFDPALPVAFNDVDYTERIRRSGLRVVLCNSVTLHHFESKSRSGHATVAEWELLYGRWSRSFDGPDPFTPLLEERAGRHRPPLPRRLRAWWRAKAASRS